MLVTSSTTMSSIRTTPPVAPVRSSPIWALTTCVVQAMSTPVRLAGEMIACTVTTSP